MVNSCDGHGWCSVVVDLWTGPDAMDFALDSESRRNSISFDLTMGRAGSVTMFRWYGRTGMALDVDVSFHSENRAADIPPHGTANLRPQAGIT